MKKVKGCRPPVWRKRQPFMCRVFRVVSMPLHAVRSEVLFLDILEVFVGPVFKFVRGGLVADDDAVLMELQGRDGPHLRNAAFDGGFQRCGFVVAVAEDEHFACCHHCADANGQCVGGHIVRIAAEEA